MDEELIELTKESTDIREYNERMEVEIYFDTEFDRLVIRAFNEAGYNHVRLDVLDIIKFLRENHLSVMEG